MHEEEACNGNPSVEMTLLNLIGLVTEVDEEDPVDLLSGVISAADICAYVKTGVVISAVLPVGKIDFRIIDKEVLVTGVTVNDALLDPVLL